MKKLSYADYMNDEFSFLTKEDERKCLECWEQDIELTVDNFGKVYNEGGLYIADVEFVTKEEE